MDTRHRKIAIALAISRNKDAKRIINHKNQLVGWIHENGIFNKDYELTGILRDNKAFTLTDEYVGDITGPYIAHKDNCYETDEPIFTSQSNIEFRNKNPKIGYDVSFRFAKGFW